jgi:ribonuclease E
MTDQHPSGGAVPPSERGFDGARAQSSSRQSSFPSDLDSTPGARGAWDEAPDSAPPAEAGDSPATDAGATLGADGLAPRRRRRRGGRRHRRGGGERAPDIAAPDNTDRAGDDLPLLEVLADDDAQATHEAHVDPRAGDAPIERGHTDAANSGADGAPRRRRGGRRRRRGGQRRDQPLEQVQGDAPRALAPADVVPGFDSPSDGEIAFPPLDDVHEFVAVPNEPPGSAPRERDEIATGDAAQRGGEPRSRRGRRGGRRRGADRAGARDNREQPARVPEHAEEFAADTPPVDGQAAAGESRRRRRRGGRGRRRERGPQTGPVGVEVIPGEEDDLGIALEPKAPAQDAAREAPTPARSAAEIDDDDAPRIRPGKRNVILVNASDREETRVAVVEDGQIVDFQMHVKRHENLVNDIYRGKVVNLEPAIGAAFVDFGQGRNGFLHTSDVLTVYGEKDWSLDKLLTHKIDPDEWDETAVPSDGGSERSNDGANDGGRDRRGHQAHAHDEHEGEHEAETDGEHDAQEGAEAQAERDTSEHAAEAGDDEQGEPFADEASAEDQAPAEPDAERGAGDRGPRGRGPRRGRPHERSRERKGGRGKPHVGRHRARPRLPITDLLQKGQSVVVQVTKDAIGEKGPTLTTYISIPGRYLVLMPSMQRTGVSRKIEDERERRRLKRILESLDVPAGMGVIVRTAGTGCTRADLKRDLDYLMLLWADFGKRLNLGRGPVALYEESDVAIRTIRDLFNDHTEAVIVDDERVYQRVRDFVAKLMPENLDRIQLHQGAKPLFHAHNVEQDFERIFARRIDLPSGGSIVFDQAEALVAIDVNSGKTRTDSFEFEDVALRTNLDAVAEIARQIRLRDLGGIIVCDFIDMARSSGRKAVERGLAAALAGDRARSKLGRISQFGLLELTRQRLGPGLSKMLFHNCPRCRGSGRIRTVESRGGSILRRLGAALALKGFSKVEVRTQPEVVEHLKRNYSAEIRDLGLKNEREIELVPVSDQIEDSVLRYLRTDGREVRPGGRRKR